MKLWNKKSLKDKLSGFIYLYFHLYSLYIKVHTYIIVTFHVFGFILKKVPLTCISIPNMWSQKYVWLRHIHNMQYWPVAGVWKWDTIVETGRQNYLHPKHIHIFDYCDIALWPITALAASSITDVRDCHLCWIFTSFTSSRLLWMNELSDKSYLFFQTSPAVSTCTGCEIISKMMIPLETLSELQWNILWRSW
jgi:hypothetical protein